ncbi:hypothetical protein QOZ80_6BG0459990 [Eleusine coracana subsp. coracana]|nr:hypothetical protein QOZ80_6BG0459990 [Eleusine coracana subsp. coracana]
MSIIFILMVPQREALRHGREGICFFKEEHYLVEALVDQYNEDHHHFEDFAHELERIVKYAWMFENERWFYHFNFTTKTKAGSGILFFAEVSRMHQEDAWEVKCCCMISSDDKGHCCGCINYGSPGMQHPNDTSAFAGGHSAGYLPYGGDELSGSDEDVEAGEDRLRAIFEEHEDPDVLEEIYNMANTPTDVLVT